MMRFSLVLTAVLALGACGDDSGSGPAADARRIDAAPPPDGAMTGMIAGSLASITLTERNPMDLMPIASGCATTLTGAAFSAEVDPFMAARRPKPSIPPSFLEAQRRGLIRHGQEIPTGAQFAAGPGDAGTPDAAPGGDGGAAGCQTLTSYPDAGALAADAQAAGYGDGTEMDYFINWIGLMGEDPASAVLVSIELWPGFGMLASPAAPGTYTLSGMELDYQTCGVCVFTFGELTFDSMGRITDSNELFFATGGTVTLTTVQ